MISGILFDVDNTLIERDKAFRELVVDDGNFCEEDAERLIELDRNGYGDRSRLFGLWKQLTGESINSKVLGLALARKIPKDMRILKALKVLSRDFKLGIITNGSVATQSAKWKAAGLEEAIPADSLWISESVGIEKPDPRIFQIACRAINLEPHSCLFVGDQTEIDIAGAINAGLSACLVTSPLTPERVFEVGEIAKSISQAA